MIYALIAVSMRPAAGVFLLPSKDLSSLDRGVKKEPAPPFSASIALMNYSDPAILRNEEVRARTSEATLRVLRNRAEPPQRTSRFLSDELFASLQELVDAILPQQQVGTEVPIADTIDRRLQKGESAGWRYAALPPDGEAYVQGLTIFNRMLQQTPMKTFAAMPPPAREGYLRCVANGDVDGPAEFPLSLWLKMVRVDISQAWVSHPQAMRAMQYFGFADGAIGNEGWVSIGPNSAAPFEYGGMGEEAAR